jgi:hypothetical protein
MLKAGTTPTTVESQDGIEHCDSFHTEVHNADYDSTDWRGSFSFCICLLERS